MSAFYIDTFTKGCGVLISRLAKLKTTQVVYNDGAYHQGMEYTRVYIESSWTEEQLESWLYKAKGIEYVGVCATEQRGC